MSGGWRGYPARRTEWPASDLVRARTRIHWKNAKIIVMRLTQRASRVYESALGEPSVDVPKWSRYAVLIVCLVLAVSAPATAQDDDPDDLLYDRVIRKIVSDRRLKTDAVNIAVKDGVVTLTGTVETEKMRLRVEKVVKKIKGVKQVLNEVSVRIRK